MKPRLQLVQADDAAAQAERKPRWWIRPAAFAGLVLAAGAGLLWWQPGVEQRFELLGAVVAVAWIIFRVRDIREAERQPVTGRVVVIHEHRRAGWW